MLFWILWHLTWLFSLLHQFSSRMIPAESFQINMGIREPKSLASCSSRVIYNQAASWSFATISIGVWKVQSCIASQGAQDCSPCLQEFGTFIGAGMPWEEAPGCVNTPVKILSSAQCSTWEQRGWATAGRKHVVRGLWCSSHLPEKKHCFLTSLLLIPHVFPQAIYQTELNVHRQNKISFVKTRYWHFQVWEIPF